MYTRLNLPFLRNYHPHHLIHVYFQVVGSITSCNRFSNHYLLTFLVFLFFYVNIRTQYHLQSYIFQIKYNQTQIMDIQMIQCQSPKTNPCGSTNLGLIFFCKIIEKIIITDMVFYYLSHGSRLFYVSELLLSPLVYLEIFLSSKHY